MLWSLISSSPFFPRQGGEQNEDVASNLGGTGGEQNEGGASDGEQHVANSSSNWDWWE